MPSFEGILSRREMARGRRPSWCPLFAPSRKKTRISSPLARKHFEVYCGACHGVGGEGDPDGSRAPSLNDPIWLYAGTEAQIAAQTLYVPRHGVMPGWTDRLGDVTVRKLAIFVHSLGGGE